MAVGDVAEIGKERKRGTRGRPFRAGESGNPGGRAKLPKEFHELARAAAPKALQMAISFVEDESLDPRVRLQAAEMVMSRAFGRPRQEVAAEVTSNVRSVTVAELMEMARQADEAE